MRTFRKILLVLLVIFLVLQAFRPAKNRNGDTSRSIARTYTVPPAVQQILAKACYDCHSNNTRYPWYAEVQPVGWWLADHVKDGKRHLNFDEFTSGAVARRYKRLDECIEEVKNGDMPLPSYTIIHKDAVLTDSEKQTLYAWCDGIRDSIRAHYPADSLVLKRK